MKVDSVERFKCIIGSARGVSSDKSMRVTFFWSGKVYTTDVESPHNKEGDHIVTWNEEFEFFNHPASEQILKLELLKSDGTQYGRVHLDLYQQQSGASDAFYLITPPKGHPKSDVLGHIRVKLIKHVMSEEEMSPAAISSVLPCVLSSLDHSVAVEVEEKYLAGLTKEERMAYYDQKGLRPAWKNVDELSSDDEAIEPPLPSGKAIGVFWELKAMMPGFDDRTIYKAMAKNDNDLNAVLEHLQRKQNKTAREVRKHEYLDGGKLAQPEPERNMAQEKKNINFMKGAVAGQMLDVPLFDGSVSGMARQVRRKALLIGCDYQKQTDASWSLHGGPLQDIRRVRNWLETVWGFADEEGRMMMMADDHPQDPCTPTASNIIRALEWLARDAQPGDSLFLYFSGHGGTKEDGATDARFPGPRPFWYGIDGLTVDIKDIYEKFLIGLPDACRVTFLIDCPNFHLWQPFYFMPQDLTLRSSSHQYFLPSDIQAFCSIGHPIHSRGGRFTNAFLSLTSGANVNSSYYELLHKLNKELDIDVPTKLSELTGTRMNYFTCSQRQNLRRPFDLNTYVPNGNEKIGPAMLKLNAVVKTAPTYLPSFNCYLNITNVDANKKQLPAAQPAKNVFVNVHGNYGINDPKKKSGVRAGLRTLLSESKPAKH